MSPSKSFYGESLFKRNKRSYGYHPKCKKCRTLFETSLIDQTWKWGKCKDPQYAARGVADFYCADYKE